MSPTARNSLLGIEPLAARDIEELLRLARKFNVAKPRPVLRDRRVALLFSEASKRTRV